MRGNEEGNKKPKDGQSLGVRILMILCSALTHSLLNSYSTQLAYKSSYYMSDFFVNCKSGRSWTASRKYMW